MRVLAAAVVTAAIVVVTGVTAVPAQAQPSPDVTSTSLTSPYAEAGTGASVIASMKQWEYADISYNVSFEGFTALGAFPFGRGSCPASLVTVSATAKVFKCGWGAARLERHSQAGAPGDVRSQPHLGDAG